MKSMRKKKVRVPGLESGQKQQRHSESRGTMLIQILLPTQWNAKACYIMSVLVEYISTLLLGFRIQLSFEHPRN